MLARIARATFSGGCSLPLNAAGSVILSQISVRIGPGLIRCTLTPVPCRSTARTSLHPAIACFAAVYAASRALGSLPATEDTFTM